MKNDLTMYQALVESANKYPNDLALYYQGTKISFKSLVKRVDDMADILYNRLNIKEDDVVMISQPNIPETVVLFYAINKLGAIANFVHPYTPFNQVEEIIKKTNTKVAFLFEQRIAKEVDKYRESKNQIYVTRIEDDLPLFKKLFYHFFMNFKIRKKLGKKAGFKGFKYVHKLKPTNKQIPYINKNNKKCSVYLPSGSTTGKPKTICLNDYAFNYIAMHTDSFMSVTKEQLRGQKMLSILPSFHGFGLCMTMHVPIYNGYASILIPRFRVKKVIKVMNKIKPTVMCGVPTIYEKLISDPSFAKPSILKHLRWCFCGGDVLSKELLENFNNVVRQVGSDSCLLQGYGLTEAIAVNCVNTFETSRDGSLGKPIPEATFKIVDENDNELPRNQVGEIVIKSAANMLGYYQDEEATNKCLKDGYLHTGDLGYIDEDGFIYFKARKKRVVKVSGVAVFPSEVEQLIESIPEVKACAAISIPDQKLQNSIKVCVVSNVEDENNLKDKIIEKCRKYLIKWSVPTEIEFRKELPLTMFGKVDFISLQKEEDTKRGLL